MQHRRKGRCGNGVKKRWRNGLVEGAGNQCVGGREAIKNQKITGGRNMR